VVTLDELHCQLAEVDENLCGSTLSPAEEKLFVRRRKEIYEELHPETRNGASGNGRKKVPQNAEATSTETAESADLITTVQIGQSNSSTGEIPQSADRFTLDTAKKTGKSERAVQRIIAVANELGEAVLTGIAGTSLELTLFDYAGSGLSGGEGGVLFEVAGLDASILTERSSRRRNGKPAASAPRLLRLKTGGFRMK